MTTKDIEGNKGEVTDTTKVTFYCRIYKRVRKVRGGCMWSSARWVMSIAGMVESYMCAARCSMRVAGVDRVVEIQLDV